MSGGTNFGLNDNLEYTEFEFDSFDTSQSFINSYYSQDWPNFFMGKPLQNVAAIKILEAQIPFSYYVFNSINNTFTLTESDGGGAVLVSIPVGNYTSTTILTALATALNTVSPNSHAYTVTFSASTQLLTVTSNAGGTKTFTLTFGGANDNGNTNPRLALGFTAGASASNTSQTLVAENVIQLTGPNYMFLCSRTLGPLVHLYLPGNGEINPTGSGADGPQIAKIPITSQPGGVTFWQDPAPLFWFDMGNTGFTGNLDLYFTLGTNNPDVPVSFNGASFSVKLGILTNTTSHNDWLGGGKQNDRVVARTWPTGGSRF